jgi:hypothetical protein
MLVRRSLAVQQLRTPPSVAKLERSLLHAVHCYLHGDATQQKFAKLFMLPKSQYFTEEHKKMQIL